MKLNIKLGVPTEALLKHPTTCFNLSKAATRVSTALSFGEFYLKNNKSGVLLPRDLEHMSASIYSSSKSADDLIRFIEDPELRRSVEYYSAAARRFNNEIRKNLPSVKKLKDKAKGVEKPVKPVTIAQMTRHTAALREKLNDIEKKVENLCTVEPLATVPVATPTMKGRVGMAGGAGLKKIPMYPRYFVASMGRTRR